jgi:hypothetical protein
MEFIWGLLMADLKVTVDYSQVKTANQEINKVGSAAEKSARVFAAAFKRAEAEQKRSLDTVRQHIALSQKLEAQRAKEAKLTLDFSRRMQAQKGAEAKAEQVAIQNNIQAINRFRSSYDQAYSVQQKTLQLKTMLRQAIANETMTVREAGAELLRYRQALIASEHAQTRFGKSMNRTGVLTQQAGYQVGDFLVQIQSGTNPMVAFGQQATQLVGALYYLPPAALAARTSILGFSMSFGAMLPIIGIALPLITALGVAFLRTRKGAEGSDEVLLKTADALKKVREETTDAAQALALLKSGFETIGELSLDTQIKSLESQISAIEASQQGRPAGYGAPAGTYTAEELEKMTSAGLEANTRKLEDQAAILRDQLAIKVAARNELRAEEARVEAINLFYENRAKLEEEQLERRRAVAQILKEAAEKEEERLAAVADITAELTTQYNLAKVEAQWGKDSAEYRKAERTAAVAAAVARWDAAGATEAEKRILSVLLLDSLDLEDTIRNQADAAKDMAERLKEAASAMRGLSNFSVGLDQRLAVAAAEVAALKSGADVAVAGTIAGLRFDLESKISAVAATGVDRGIIEKMFGPEREKLAQYGTRLTEKGALGDSPQGGADKETAEERLSALLKTAESERDLVGVEEERATQLRRAFTLTEQISQMEGGLTEERMKSIQTIVDLEAKTRLLQEAEEKREAQIDEIVGHIRSAFDSLIDGTETVEEAFRKMMYNIAKSIWEQQVMDPLANAATKWITNTFFSAKGSAWNNGVQMFANGGVVNSATPFRHAGGMGIMGEAGAEAIMPLKRGPDGKLGVAGGGGVVIHQNFNFSANGDESVKRIIAQEAPKIASMTQGQIMDARRRGGAMRNTFG